MVQLYYLVIWIVRMIIFYCLAPRMIIFVVDLSFQGATVFKFTTHFVSQKKKDTQLEEWFSHISQNILI